MLRIDGKTRKIPKIWQILRLLSEIGEIKTNVANLQFDQKIRKGKIQFLEMINFLVKILQKV